MRTRAVSVEKSKCASADAVPWEVRCFIRDEPRSTRRVCRLGTDPRACGLAAPSSCGEQSLAGTLERAVGGQVVVERAGRNVTELAADLWN